MQYLSKEIEALAKRKHQTGNSLVKKEYSCGIFQDYGEGNPIPSTEDKSDSENLNQ